MGGGGAALGSENATSWVQIPARPFTTVQPQASHSVSLCPRLLSPRVGRPEDRPGGPAWAQRANTQVRSLAPAGDSQALSCVAPAVWREAHLGGGQSGGAAALTPPSGDFGQRLCAGWRLWGRTQAAPRHRSQACRAAPPRKGVFPSRPSPCPRTVREVALVLSSYAPLAVCRPPPASEAATSAWDRALAFSPRDVSGGWESGGRVEAPP